MELLKRLCERLQVAAIDLFEGGSSFRVALDDTAEHKC